jgi:hypothetical protein
LNGSDEHPCHVWHLSTHDDIYSRLYKAHGRGREEDALYIADLFDQKVMEYNPLKTCTDVFYFDGASNVQKAGEVSMARFPCLLCFHRGEHVVSLFFSSIAKIKPVKVCLVFALLGYIQSIDSPFFPFYRF